MYVITDTRTVITCIRAVDAWRPEGRHPLPLSRFEILITLHNVNDSVFLCHSTHLVNAMSILIHGIFPNKNHAASLSAKTPWSPNSLDCPSYGQRSDVGAPPKLPYDIAVLFDTEDSVAAFNDNGSGEFSYSNNIIHAMQTPPATIHHCGLLATSWV